MSASELRIGVLLIATGTYVELIEPLLASMDAHFFRAPDAAGQRVRTQYFLFTDAPAGRYPARGDLTAIRAERLGWPGDTLYRYHRFCSIAERIRACGIDVLYYIDADMRIADAVGREFLPAAGKPLLGVIHPGFFGQPSGGSPERRPQSSACIGADETYPRYICGGVQGGLTEAYLQAAACIRDRIDADDRNGIVAVFHDESHWNRHMASHADAFTLLPPDYCYPDSYLDDADALPGCVPRIVALSKGTRHLGLRRTLGRRFGRVRGVLLSAGRAAREGRLLAGVGKAVRRRWSR